MGSCRRVLIVAPNQSVADRVIGWASSEGYQALVCTDFAEAKPELEARPPDLLITERKLGAFNGLHLAIRAHSRGLCTPTIIIGEADAQVEAEAHRYQAEYLTESFEPAALETTARAMLAGGYAAAS
jgi:DNA-binding response OmpR family regulator